MNMELDDHCTLSDWEAVLEIDEALAGWLLQGSARGEWGWEWGWPASDLQDHEWDNEDIPAVSCPPLVNMGKLENVLVWRDLCSSNRKKEHHNRKDQRKGLVTSFVFAACCCKRCSVVIPHY